MSDEVRLSRRPRDRRGRSNGNPRRQPPGRRLVGRLPRKARRLLVVGAAGAAGSAVLCAAGGVAGTVVVARRWTRRVVVEGRSMLPTVEPGDRLLVVRLPRRWPVRPGDLVALPDPRDPDRLLVKRVAAVRSGRVTVTGDNAAESSDSRAFGPVGRHEVWGRAWYRYAPPSRSGRVARRARP